MAPQLGDLLATFPAVCRARAHRHSRTRDHDRIREGIVDLILNRSIGSPTAGHSYGPHSCLDSANGKFMQSLKVLQYSLDD